MKNRNLKVDQRITIEYRDANSDYWVPHSQHDSLRQAVKVRKICVEDEASRGTGTVWRIVQWKGRVASILPASRSEHMTRIAMALKYPESAKTFLG